MPSIRERLDLLGRDVPLVGDFHYNGHRLLADHPGDGPALAKFRINPGNVGFGDKRDRQFELMVEAALRFERPVRIGVNWGSLDQDLAARLMDRNAGRASRGRATSSCARRWSARPWTAPPMPSASALARTGS